MQDSKEFALSRWVVLALVVSSIAFLSVGYLRSESGLIHTFDTGLYLQLLSNLGAGRGWDSSITGEHLFLAHHFQPVLALLVPLHALVTSAFALLVVSWVFTLAASLFLMYFLPRKGIASARSAQCMGLALFLHPTLSSRMYYSFVPEIMALPALVYLAYLLVEKG